MRIRTTAALLVTMPGLLFASGQAPLRVDKVTISSPTTLKDIDTGKAQASRLAWSPDGSELYVQTFEGSFVDLNKGLSTVKLRHYVFSAADGAKKDLQAEPDWAREYWTVKSNRHAPDAPQLLIDLKEERKQQKAVSTPMGGALAKGGEGGTAGTSSGDAIAAAHNIQTVSVLTMSYKGEKVGEFVNTVIVPGLTYGWGPEGTKAIAFTAQKSGRVVLMDDQGGKKEIGGTKNAALPAWSEDGKKIAWLQKDGKKKFLLQVATVSGS